MISRRSFVLSAGAATVLTPGLAGQPAHGVPASPAETLPPAILALKNRRSEAVPITLAERETRFERARSLMRAQTIDAIAIAGSTSLTYFTGMRWGNSERMFLFVLPQKGAAFFLCPVFEEERVRERLSNVPDGKNAKIYTWEEDESPSTLLAKALLDQGLRTGVLGIEERTPYTFAYAIAQANPSLQLADGTPVIAGCRMIKSAAEIKLMQLASNVTLEVYRAAYQAGHPGMTTHQFSAMIGAAYDRIGFPGEASCQTGIYSALPHGSLTPQIIQENEIAMIDDGCTVEGYQSDLTRTFVYGKPTDKMRSVFDIVHRAQSAALAAAKPGVACEAVDAAARKVISDAGYGPDYKFFTHRVGHGMGMDGHEWTYLVRGNRTPLQAGMVFSDEPGVYIRGEFGVRLEDDMVIRPGGAELLTPQSPSLTDPCGSI